MRYRCIEVIATAGGNGTKIQIRDFWNPFTAYPAPVFCGGRTCDIGQCLQTMTGDLLTRESLASCKGGATWRYLFIQFQTNAYFIELGDISIYLLPWQFQGT